MWLSKCFYDIIVIVAFLLELEANWEEWWTYDGISGPDYWGLLNPDWRLCNRGRHQSPVDIDPSVLLYDPTLGPLHVDSHRVSGTISNTGRSVIFRVNPSNSGVVIRGGPLTYHYRITEAHLHIGRTDERGSEHTVGGHAFPAELQVFGYNYDLYDNMSEAQQRAQGVVGLALILKLGNLSNPELRFLTNQASNIIYKGQTAQVNHISFRGLLPNTSHYVTYDGSLTMPACQETVTWIIMNKPIYITKQQLYSIRRLVQGEIVNPKTTLADNFRPPLPLYRRAVRTNIVTKYFQGNECASEKNVIYKASNVISNLP
ncbi:carbonic anhydrase-related protein 10-like [Centruroides vittatus]|uniref:carbonic anhydrase-related protein 10-like n=1 Tax=Centruroides vittatus TaxID=120091 RepID=UPI000C6E6E1D|nr:carbonic anhydrase-related protein 10-like isoform X2 [Centruroides sculpturatus]